MTRTLVSVILLFPAALLIGCHGTRPPSLGARDGKLAACPERPNCISSQVTDETHRIDPLPYSGSGAHALAQLSAIVRSLPRTTIAIERPDYVHAEFTSRIFRFVDDVEFFADDTAKVIHVRSASRLGHSDLGVNRKRVEMIRRRWQEAAP